MLFSGQHVRFSCRHRSLLSLEKDRRRLSWESYLLWQPHCLKMPLSFECSSPSLGLESRTPAGCQHKVSLPVTVNPATLEPESTCEPDARCNSSQASTPAACCEPPRASANTGHLSHILPLLLWACLLRKWPHQTPSSTHSTDQPCSDISLGLSF